MRKIKNIVILAGGDSTRFWPLKNKNLYSFAGTPLIKFQADRLKEHCENLIIVANKKNAEDIKKICSFKVVVQKDNLPGQAGAIMSVKNLIDGEILIVNANDIFNLKILSQFNTKLDEGAEIILLAKKVTDYFPGGYLKLENNKVVNIVEKPDPQKIPSDVVRLVVDYFKNFRELVDVLFSIESKNDDLYEEGINVLIKKKNTDYILYKNYWYSLKYPWQVLQLMNFFLSKLKKREILNSSNLSKKAEIVGSVKFGENVKVGDFTKIVGPCFIDDDTTIGDYCLIRKSHIGKNCIIGGFCEVARSYLADNISLHRNYVGDSVLDNKVELGAQAAIANFRFDRKTVKSQIGEKKIDTNMVKLGAIIGEGSKLGVNMTTLPGVKIGRNSLIVPGEVVIDDIEDGVFFFRNKVIKNKILK